MAQSWASEKIQSEQRALSVSLYNVTSSIGGTPLQLILRSCRFRPSLRLMHTTVFPCLSAYTALGQGQLHFKNLSSLCTLLPCCRAVSIDDWNQFHLRVNLQAVTYFVLPKYVQHHHDRRQFDWSTDTLLLQLLLDHCAVLTMSTLEFVACKLPKIYIWIVVLGMTMLWI